jgi:hypothetical protein
MLLRTVTLSLAVALLSVFAIAAGDPASEPPGSAARQLLLKYRLQRIAGTSLAAQLNHNRKEWESLSPDLREKYRKDALAFLQKSPQEQEQLLKFYENLVKLSAGKQDEYRRRADWLKVVVASYTPAERTALAGMGPQERAAKLLERKKELMAEGKLPAESKPSSMPSSQSKPSTAAP